LLPGLARDVLGGEPADEIGPGPAVDETTYLKRGKATVISSLS
jgi:hypothetical protein